MTKRPSRPRSTTGSKRATSPTRTSSARSSSRPRTTTRNCPQDRKPAVQLTPAQRNWLIGVLLLTLALVTFLSLTRVNLGTLTADWVHGYVTRWVAAPGACPWR